MYRVTIALCLLLSACTASHEPIVGEEGIQADTRLIGRWRFTLGDDDLEPSLLIISELPDGRLLVESMPEDPSGNNRERLELLTARVAGESYGSAALIDEPAEPGGPRYGIFRYELESPRRVRLRIAAIPYLEEAVRMKQLSGRKHADERHGVDVFEITSVSTELRAFVTEHGPRVFSLEGPLLERLPEE